VHGSGMVAQLETIGRHASARAARRVRAKEAMGNPLL